MSRTSVQRAYTNSLPARTNLYNSGAHVHTYIHGL